MADTPAIAKPSTAYDVGESKRALPRALWGGTKAMREAGATYLPPHEGERLIEKGATESDYQRRLNSSFLIPSLRKVVGGLVGQVFQRQIQLAKDVPDVIRQWCEDVDLRGNNLHNFARPQFAAGWRDRFSLILVDYPEVPEGAAKTREQESALGLRPFLVAYLAGDLINWRRAVINGVLSWTLAVFKESVQVDDGEWGEVTITRYRGYRLVEGVVHLEVWEQRGDEWSNPVPRHPLKAGGKPLPLIPLVLVPIDPEGDPLCSDPPLEDWCYLAVRDWQKQSDLDNIEHVVNVPVTATIGAGDSTKTVPWGPTVQVNLPGSADMKYIEHSGKGIEALKQSIADGREMMRDLAHEPQLPRTGDQVATSDAIRAAGAQAPIMASALALQDALERCLQIMALFGKVELPKRERKVGKNGKITDRGGSVIVNTKFNSMPREAADVAEIKAMRDAREITRETRWKEAQRREILGDDFDPVAEAEALEQEASAELKSAGADRQIARRVAELVASGMDAQAALAQAESEADGETQPVSDVAA